MGLAGRGMEIPASKLPPNFHSEGRVMPSLVSPCHTNCGRGIEIRIQYQEQHSNRLGVLGHDPRPPAPPPPPLAAFRGRLCEDGRLSVHSGPGVSHAEVDPSALPGSCVSNGIRLQQMGIGFTRGDLDTADH